ncbi:MAG: hypothetical protein HRU17_07650 [Polyangiaceae bacterium]|nr:hypothetical protein [Polyangiaceae bacterium]
MFFSGDKPLSFLAMGNDLFNNPLGCSNRVFLGSVENGQWQEPIQMTKGDVA